MKKIYLLSTSVLLCASLHTNAQLGKLKSLIPAKKETTETSVVPDSVREKKGGQNLWSKVVAKAAKAAGNLAGSMMGMVGTTADLESVVPGAYYMSNLHPTSVGVVSQSFFEGWEPSGNVVMLSFSSKNKVQFNKIEGTVNVDGKPANYVALGIYSLFFKDNNTKKVEVETNSGQKLAFTINPPKQSVKILSINGQTSNVSLDLTKDVALELQNLPSGNQTPVMVSLTGNTLGIKTFYEVGWFAPAPKITIPAAMFRNMNGATSNISFTDAYLQVSRSSTDKATNVSGVFPEMEYYNIVNDGKFITVTGKPVFNKGLVAAATEKFPKGEVSYEVKKPNAIYSPNLTRIKTLGFTSFAIQGKTSYYDSKTKYSGNDTYTTTTKTAQFPQFSDAVWDNILDKMYVEVVEIVKTELGANVLSIEKIAQSKGYEKIVPFSKEEENTKSEFVRSYKGTKLLSGLRPISETNGRKTGEHLLMQETGANATMRFVIGLNMSFEGAKAYMTPTLFYEIGGEVVGDVMNTTYLTGTVTGAGVPIQNKGTVSVETLENDFLRRADLLAAFRKSLQDIKAKEKANGDYEIEWAAMNK